VLPVLPFLAWTFARGTPDDGGVAGAAPPALVASQLPELLRGHPGRGRVPDGPGTLTLSRLPREKRAVLAWFFVGFALLFVFGTVFTEFVPMKAVLQFQPHRCWRFLMLILYGLAATGIVEGWRSAAWPASPPS
jgi:hypothetical protein